MVTHIQRGDLAMTHDNLAMARKEYEESQSIALKLLEQDPGNADHKRDLSVSYSKLGGVAQAGGDLAAARAAYEKDLELTKGLAEADPTNVVLKRDLSVSYNKLGQVARAGGDLAAARAAYDEDLELTKELAEADTNNAGLKRNPSATTSSGMSHRRAATCQRHVRLMTRNLELTKALAEGANTTNAGLKRDLSVSYNKLGDVAAAGGNLAAARAAYDKGLELRKALAEADPTNAGAQARPVGQL